MWGGINWKTGIDTHTTVWPTVLGNSTQYSKDLNGKSAKITQSCLTLCNLRDYSPPGCSVHGILQARILEWVAIPFSRGSSPLRD